MGFAILIQAVVALVLVLGFALWRTEFFASAAVGAVLAIGPNAVFALYLAIGLRAEVHRFFVGEAIKIGCALAGAAYVWANCAAWIAPLPYWLVFIIVLKTHNFALLRTEK